MANVLVFDGSIYGIEAVIYQIFPDGRQKEIVHASRLLKPEESNYRQMEEKHYQSSLLQILYGRHFILITDHTPFIAFFYIKIHSCICRKPSTKMVYYDVRLQFSIKYNSSNTVRQTD